MSSDLPSRLCEHALSALALHAWRTKALEALREIVRFDAGFFHELSPRAPIGRAGLLGLDAARLSSSISSWDDHAVDLAPMRIKALSQGGVATDREAFGHRGRARARWDRLVSRPLGVRSALVVHLLVDRRIISGIFLVRRGDPPFSSSERRSLSPLVPVLAVCDGLRLSRDESRAAGLATEVRCLDQRLTPRQREVVELVALGRTNEEIGIALGISPNTVRNLLVKTRARVGAANRAELVRVAVLR